MHPIRRTAAAVVAAATLALAPLAHAEAAVHAKPHGAHAAHGDKAAGKPGKSGKSGKSRKAAAQVRAVLKQVVIKDRALARVASRHLVTLPDEQESALGASVAADRAALAGLRAAVEAGTTAPRPARATLKTYRVENYLQAVAVLRDAAELSDLAVELPEVLELVDGAVETVLGVTATGGRAALKTARSGLEDAWALYEELTAEPEECVVDEFEDCSDDGTDDGTDDGVDTEDGTDEPEVEPLG